MYACGRRRSVGQLTRHLWAQPPLFLRHSWKLQWSPSSEPSPHWVTLSQTCHIGRHSPEAQRNSSEKQAAPARTERIENSYGKPYRIASSSGGIIPSITYFSPSFPYQSYHTPVFPPSQLSAQQTNCPIYWELTRNTCRRRGLSTELHCLVGAISAVFRAVAKPRLWQANSR